MNRSLRSAAPHVSRWSLRWAGFQTRPLQLRSALSNRVFYAGSAQGFRRTNVLTFGIDKSLDGLPRWIAPVSAKSTPQVSTPIPSRRSLRSRPAAATARCTASMGRAAFR